MVIAEVFNSYVPNRNAVYNVRSDDYSALKVTFITSDGITVEYDRKVLGIFNVDLKHGIHIDEFDGSEATVNFNGLSQIWVKDEDRGKDILIFKKGQHSIFPLWNRSIISSYILADDNTPNNFENYLELERSIEDMEDLDFLYPIK